MSMIASSGQLRASYIRWALFLVPAIVLLGVMSGQLSGSGADNPWFAALEKPALYPPGWTFGVVWTVLYALMGLALAMILAARGARGRGLATAVFLVQLALNLAWSPVFFGAHSISGALGLIVAIDIAVGLTLILFWRIRRLAGILLLPYLAWVLFATYLTWDIHRLNDGMDGGEVSGAVQRVEF